MLDFGWGNPYFLLDTLKKHYNKDLKVDIESMSYAPDPGISELVRLTKEVIKYTTGLDYKYVIITAGATGAINVILRHYKDQHDMESVVTLKYGYPYYNDMIKRAGLIRKEDDGLKLSGNNEFRLIDSPSNPKGMQINGSHIEDPYNNDIWDSVYHNKIYTEDLSSYPDHAIMVGSYSKLLGVTGVRIGFVATQNEIEYRALLDWHTKETAAVSLPSQLLVLDILKNIDLGRFLSDGKSYLDYNKERFQEIEYLFDNQPVQKNGMFYCAFINKKNKQILDDCGINYIVLENDYLRLNLGQTKEKVDEAIKTVLKKDRIK